MVTYLPRSAWGARPARGTALNPSEVLNVAFHWPGMSKPIDASGDIGKRRVASALRGWQAFHMDGRGWSDIAYQVAIDQAGRVWTLRGINIKSGANGDGTVNRKYGAILLILGPGEKMSPQMKASARSVVADYRKRYRRMPVKPTTHSAVRPAGTACPGPAAISAIKAGELNASTAKPPASTEDDMPLTAADKAWISADNDRAESAYAIRFWVTEGGTGEALIDMVQEILMVVNRIEDDTDQTATLRAKADKLQASFQTMKQDALKKADAVKSLSETGASHGA